MKMLYSHLATKSYVKALYKDGTTQPVAYQYIYNYTDHLGNIRLSYALDEETNQVKTLEENHYYPFGLKHGFYNEELYEIAMKQQAQNEKEVKQTVKKGYNYKYNGKEWQDELGLQWYDYGARNYDATLGRWMNIDPLAEKRASLTPYNYVQSNPLNLIDPDGLTDYTINKETGKVEQVGEKNDDPDRVLKTNRKGKVKIKGEGFLGFLVRKSERGKKKVAIDGVAKGILEDGQNFKDDDNIFEIGGKWQLTVSDVKTFVLGLSEYIGREIKGFSYSANGTDKATDVLLGKYKNNSYKKSFGTLKKIRNKYGIFFSYKNILEQFHTHPDGIIGATATGDPFLSQDIIQRNIDKKFTPNAKFIILYRIFNQIKPGEYDYSN